MGSKKQSTEAQEAETVLVKLNLPRTIHTRLRAFASGSELTVGEAAAKVLDQGLPRLVTVTFAPSEKREPQFVNVAITHSENRETGTTGKKQPNRPAQRRRK